MRVDEKHFAAGATCKMYKGNLVSFGEFGDVPVAFKESIVPVTRGTKRSISKEVGLFRQLEHQNVDMLDLQVITLALCHSPAKFPYTT